MSDTDDEEGPDPTDGLTDFEAQFSGPRVEAVDWAEAAVPIVPEVPDRPHVDRGVGGSLYEAADRIDAERTLPPARRDPLSLVAGLLGAVVVALVVWIVLRPWSVAITAVAIAAAILVGGLVILAVLGIRGPLPPAERLREEARLEERVARQLALPPQWRLLSDRVLPGTEHRVPFLLVGPAGVLVASLLPRGPYGEVDGGGLVAGEDELSPWIATRRWEASHLCERLMNSTEGRFTFSGPVYILALAVHPPALADPPLQPEPPRIIEGLTAVRTPAACRGLLASLPAVLPAQIVDDLEAQVNRLCPPAPSGPTPA